MIGKEVRFPEQYLTNFSKLETDKSEEIEWNRQSDMQIFKSNKAILKCLLAFGCL